MSKEKIKALEMITSHKGAKHRKIIGAIKVQISSDVQWLDRSDKPCYNEIFYKKIWFLGFPVWDRRYCVYHRDVDITSKNSTLGFTK